MLLFPTESFLLERCFLRFKDLFSAWGFLCCNVRMSTSIYTLPRFFLWGRLTGNPLNVGKPMAQLVSLWHEWAESLRSRPHTQKKMSEPWSSALDSRRPHCCSFCWVADTKPLVTCAWKIFHEVYVPVPPCEPHCFSPTLPCNCQFLLHHFLPVQIFRTVYSACLEPLC